MALVRLRISSTCSKDDQKIEEAGLSQLLYEGVDRRIFQVIRLRY